MNSSSDHFLGFLLPETLGQKMLGTIEEAEEFYKNPKAEKRESYMIARKQ